MRPRKKVKEKVTSSTLINLEHKSIEELEKEWEKSVENTFQQDEKFVESTSSPTVYISQPANIPTYKFDSVAEVKQKIQDLCGSIIETKMNTRSNDAVRIRAGELLGKINGIGIQEKDQMALVVDIMTIFNTYLIKTDAKLSKELTNSQRKFLELVFSSSNLTHLSYIINSIKEKKR